MLAEVVAEVPVPGRQGADRVVVLPGDPTGPALAEVVRRLRSASRTGGVVVVDLRGTRSSSPGVRRALTVLHREAARRGCSWTVLGELPTEHR